MRNYYQDEHRVRNLSKSNFVENCFSLVLCCLMVCGTKIFQINSLIRRGNFMHWPFIILHNSIICAVYLDFIRKKFSITNDYIHAV